MKIFWVGMGILMHLQALGQVDEDQLGAWYMYFYNKQFANSLWGIQGDFQYRDWQIIGDREQLLLRSGITYTPKGEGITFTLGYAHITTGSYGENNATFSENRMYQEALIPQKLYGRIHIVHRFRYEQRWVENQDFRTRYRYNLFINVTINNTDFGKGVFYAAFYNEIFINGQTNIGDDRTVEYFDRNRTYLGLGYGISKTIRIQLGGMIQTTANWQKNQLQIGIHHNF